MAKENKLMCGFCNTEIENKKDLVNTHHKRKVIISCPHCNSILGMYYA